jgi:chlorobactene glucosyltransferase
VDAEEGHGVLSLLLALPWLLLLLAFVLAVRLPRALPSPSEAEALLPSPPPLVSIVIPARNEAHNIERVLASVTASSYPRFEVIVVDDESEDGTGALARAAGRGNAERLEVIGGEPLPPGWLGKPWSCARGARVARGSLLLFTDADTVHSADLLARAIAGLEEDQAHVLSVLGRQIMASFWERLVQPHVFVMLLSRFPRGRRALSERRWRDAIANGQYLLFRRDVYDALGGHEAVKDEVVEDLRLAQIIVKSGRQLSLRFGEQELGTRMYRGLRDLVGGWTKNVALGALHTVPPTLRPVLLPASILLAVGFWLAPPVTLVAALLGAGGSGLLTWSMAVVVSSAIFWTAVCARMGSPAWFGLIYPLGAAVGAWIILRSWLRGTRVEWKGREYRVQRPA